ncbi:MAG TPA: flagellar export chaperone FliS [Polyangiaceae bacterium]|jgi:flagellar protein FliS|nr:flagellar export chaperone FliS [Polyangiaceae bacterium]
MLESAAAARYAQVRNATSTPGELLLALYDGLFRFLNGAKTCFENKQSPRARELLSKCNAIISELMIALDHDVAPELCGQLAGVYQFCIDRLQVASRKSDVTPIEEVTRVLTPLREAWIIAVPKAIQEAYAANKR